MSGGNIMSKNSSFGFKGGRACQAMEMIQEGGKFSLWGETRANRRNSSWKDKEMVLRSLLGGD